MSLVMLLIVVLLVVVIVGLPNWGYHPYGAWPSSAVGIVVVVLIILLLMGRL